MVTPGLHPYKIEPTELNPEGLHPMELYPNRIPPTKLHPYGIPPMELHLYGIPPTELQPYRIPPMELHLTGFQLQNCPNFFSSIFNFSIFWESGELPHLPKNFF